MNKQELLEKVESTISFVRSFLDEYRDEFIYENEGVLLVLLDDILHDISDGQIPMSLYERISRLLDTLNVENLRQVQQLNKERHNFTLYKEQSDNMIVNSVFVSKTYYLLKAIGFVNSNIVLIGANGSGKTTFANSIRDKLESTDNGIVIPAQKILIFPSYDFIPTYRSAYSAYQNRQKEILDDKQTFNASKSDDIPYELTKRYGSELRILVSALLGERMARRDEYCSSIQNGDVVDTNKFRSSLDDVIDIWNSLIEHRELYCDNSGNLQIKYSQGDETEEYPAFRMSDGEREIFYVVGRVLLAKPSSLIVIDEPELHLHKAILNKLWDILEVKRDDCMFVYLTHDIDFASSRVAQKLWLKSYTSGVLEDWELEPISDNDIPEVLLMKILGSRKKILFCEGKSGGIDHQIFECLFPNYTVIPVASCKGVINYTRAFNKISNKYADALGIIDRVTRTIRDIAYNMKVGVILPNVMEKIVEYYNNAPHKGLSKWAGFSVTPQMVMNDKRLEEYIVRKIVQANHEIMNRLGFQLKEGTEVKVYNEKDSLTKRRSVIQPGKFIVQGFNRGLYRVKNINDGSIQLVPRFKLNPL